MANDKGGSWAEELGDKLINPVLKKLNEIEPSKSDYDMMELMGHIMTVLVHRMVTDSLSLREADVSGMNVADCRKAVDRKFGKMRMTIEAGVVAAFETGVSVATRQETLYTCSVVAVNKSANSLPC